MKIVPACWAAVSSCLASPTSVVIGFSIMMFSPAAMACAQTA
jgi:hypothetical protein